jgi:uncharacterized protein (UPF0548 family)
MNQFNYAEVGATAPTDREWTQTPPGFRRYERTVVIGRGQTDWEYATGEVLRWGVKTRSGFRVSPRGRAVEGKDYAITVGLGRFVVTEPVRVVSVVDDEDRCAIAYGTLHGHPVSGEEAFIVHRTADGTVLFSLRSLTRPTHTAPWNLLFPGLLLLQHVVRARYLRALRT